MSISYDFYLPFKGRFLETQKIFTNQAVSRSFLSSGGGFRSLSIGSMDKNLFQLFASIF